jgi:hypothetical protein
LGSYTFGILKWKSQRVSLGLRVDSNDSRWREPQFESLDRCWRATGTRECQNQEDIVNGFLALLKGKVRVSKDPERHVVVGLSCYDMTWV